MSQDLTAPRKITKSSIDKAIKLVHRHNIEEKRRRNKETPKDKVAYYCKSHKGDKTNCRRVVGFSKSLVLSEMQSYIARQDWKHASHLFPKLLECPVELEPLVWRYALIILLHTNDPSYLRQFLEQCIGSHSSNNSTLLKRLLLLPLKE